MQTQELNWFKYANEHRANVKIKGLFGITFICEEEFWNTPKTYVCKLIVNGKKYEDMSDYSFDNLDLAKKKCEQKYNEICSKVYNKLFK